MMATTNFSVRLDSDLKKQSEALYGELGVNLTTAINVFLRKSLKVGGFPFDVRNDEPNRETKLALLEAEKLSKDPNVKGLDVEDALRELKK
ncbi:MAG: type II toxin-antitoxin system RelB/DinJ family antitoxin [Bacilli bacterium]|nr:type II toxin-antitoxin system RelB/DinJ family antitoxin [Bacilli bacterium]MDD7180601.1 type II toxin-antitoxin system RelB/DinJ family antitoxin [Bacilli bacterium]